VDLDEVRTEPMCAAMKAYVKTQIPDTILLSCSPVAAPVGRYSRRTYGRSYQATRPESDKGRQESVLVKVKKK
jgi:hypothetical protein